jgi:hypothetical protein
MFQVWETLTVIQPNVQVLYYTFTVTTVPYVIVRHELKSILWEQKFRLPLETRISPKFSINIRISYFTVSAAHVLVSSLRDKK